MKNILQNSAILYIIVGVANTIVGLGTTLLLTYLGVIPEIANTLGTIVGILNSYILNKTFTFKSKNSHKQDFIRFIIAMGISYGASMIVLVCMHRLLHINEYISLLCASVVYTIVGYIISKFWVFKIEK